MLYACGDIVGLYALDVRHHHPACQVRVFTHVLEVTAIERSTVDIDSGAEKHVLLTVTGFLTDALSIE